MQRALHQAPPESIRLYDVLVATIAVKSFLFIFTIIALFTNYTDNSALAVPIIDYALKL
jgi:hypothetical protein